MEAVCRAALAHGVALEINANPRRLDLKDDTPSWPAMGCLFAISTDATPRGRLDLMRFGVATASGLVEAKDVVTPALESLRRVSGEVAGVFHEGLAGLLRPGMRSRWRRCCWTDPGVGVRGGA